MNKSIACALIGLFSVSGLAANKSHHQAYAIANVKTGETRLCTECTPDFIAKHAPPPGIPDGATAPDRRGIPAEAKLVAQNMDGTLSVYVIDTPDRLAMWFAKSKKKESSSQESPPPAVAMLFDNERSPKKIKSSSQDPSVASSPSSSMGEGGKGVKKALTFPQKRGATYDEIRKHQSLGRFGVAPDGSFFVYEWSRPYDWAPDPSELPLATRARKQTFLFKVIVPESWRSVQPPVSEELIPSLPGATYYLGDLSPDVTRISLYQLDRDDETLRAGVIFISNDPATITSPPQKITWFDLPPDSARLDQPAVWVSNDDFVYPVKGSTALALANSSWPFVSGYLR